jgi:hypothetical protein
MNDFSCPTALSEMQTWFASIITSPYQETDDADLPVYKTNLIKEIQKRILPSPYLKSEERLGIYHQQYWWRLLSVMQELYPSLVRLFDYERFNILIAEPYLLDYPPNDWFLSNIGSESPEWLKKNYREKDAFLVLGLAQLDLAYERIIFADRLPKIEPDDFHRYETEIVYLQPYVMLFEFGVDFFSLRAQLLRHPSSHWKTHPLPKIKAINKKKFFVLFRKDEQDYYEQISESRYALLQRFQKGAKLIDLIPLIEDCDEVVKWFQTISSREWLSFFRGKEPISL